MANEPIREVVVNGNTYPIEADISELEQQIEDLNNDLTANSNKFEASYQNGKYGFTINNTFYEIGGGSMPALDYDNPLHTFDSALTYTATKTCYLLGTIHGTANNTIVSINDTPIFSARTDTTSDVVPLTRIDTGDVVKVNASAPRLHVFEEK